LKRAADNNLLCIRIHWILEECVIARSSIACSKFSLVLNLPIIFHNIGKIKEERKSFVMYLRHAFALP